MPRSSPPARAVPALEIALLGGLELRASGRLIALSARKAQAALAYLAARQGRWHAREHLQALLWPEAGKEQAQASLRQALASLRAALPGQMAGVLEARGQTLALSQGMLRVDVHTLEAHLCTGTRAALEQAAALYRGPLLEGFVLGEGPFDDWLSAERTRLHEAMLAGLDELAALQTAAGTLDAALQTVQQALRLEPLRESAQRTLMGLYVQQGNRAQALQQYESCAALLRAELGVEPEAETQRLRQQLLQPIATETRARRGAREHSDLIGRDAALATLDHWFSAGPRVVAIQGEAGIGKTRLLTALVEDVRAGAGECLTARCFESEHSLPFALWAELLRAASDRAGQPLWRGLDTVQRRELSRLVPASAPGGEQRPQLDDTRVLFEAVLKVVEGLLHRGPLLIVLEDLHWADSSSLQLLSFVARRTLARLPLRIALSLRDDALAGASALRSLLRELKRERELSTLELAPLARAHALQLLQSALSRERGPRLPGLTLEDALFQRVWSISEGNPLAITECARSLRGRERGEPAPLPIPERVRDVIAEHLAQVDAQAERVLAVAAVIGQRCSFALLEAMLALPGQSLAGSLVSLVDRRLLVSDGDGFYFTHERIREVVYQQLLETERPRLHRAAARALEQLCADRLDELAGFLAQHYARAGESERSVRYLLRFARACAHSYGFERALSALDEAEGALPALPAQTADALRVELAVQRAGCLAHLRRMPEMERCLLPLSALVERLPDARLAGTFHAWLALSQIFVGETRAAEPRAQRALAEAERCADRETAGYAHSILCFAAMRRAQFRRGVEHGQRALQLLEAQDSDVLLARASARFDPHVTAFAWLHLGGNHLLLGECAAAREAAAGAEAIAERCQSARLYTFAFALRGNARAAQGETTVGLADCHEAVARAPDPYSGFFARLVLVRVAAFAALRAGLREALEDSAFGEALRALEGAVALGPALGLGAFQGVARVALAETYLARGEAERARETAQAALALLSEEDDPFGHTCALRILGQSELALRELGAGQAKLREACQRFAALDAALELRITRQLLPASAASAPL